MIQRSLESYRFAKPYVFDYPTIHVNALDLLTRKQRRDQTKFNFQSLLYILRSLWRCSSSLSFYQIHTEETYTFAL